jgi:hypothetical protein
MANDEHVAILKKGVTAWNAWRNENTDIRPDLSGADLSERNLKGAHLNEADLSKAKLHRTNCWLANLTGAILIEANLWLTDLTGAILIRANLTGAHLSGVDLTTANLTEAILSGANLPGCYFGEYRPYGRSPHRLSRLWHIGVGSKTGREDQAAEFDHHARGRTRTVDNIEVAQFIYLLLHNEKIREPLKMARHGLTTSGQSSDSHATRNCA